MEGKLKIDGSLDVYYGTRAGATWLWISTKVDGSTMEDGIRRWIYQMEIVGRKMI